MSPLSRTITALAGLTLATSATSQILADQDKSAEGQFTLGAGAAYTPRYEGSDEYRWRALPVISYRNGRFFAGALRGIGYEFSPTPSLQFGPVLSYAFGRDQDDDARLKGLGDVKPGATLGAFVRWNIKPFFLHAVLKQGVSGDASGRQLQVGAGYMMAMTASDRIIFDASVDWADSEVMQAFFGVTPAQSSASGLGAYNAGSGIRRYGVGAIYTHAFTAQWFSTVGIAAYRLGDHAAGSPITVDRDGALFSLGFGYRF